MIVTFFALNASAAVNAVGGAAYGLVGASGRGAEQAVDLGYRLGLGANLGSFDPAIGAASLLGVGAELRQDLLGASTHTALLGRLVRTAEFLGASYDYGLLAGPEWAAGERGATLQAAASLKLVVGPSDQRAASFVSVRVEGGAAVFGDRWAPRYGLGVGAEWRWLKRFTAS